MKIYDEENLIEFLDVCVPGLVDDEVLIYFVFVRKKYCPEVRNHHQMVFRDILKSHDTNYIIQKLKKIPDKFIKYETNEYYKEDCYSCYIDLIPKSTIKAYTLFSKQMTDLLYQTYKSSSVIEEWRNIKNKLLSSIHKSTSRKPYLMIDIDNKDLRLFEDVIISLPQLPLWVSETRGGYHLIYMNNSEVNREIYVNKLFSEEIQKGIIEIKREVMTPIVGMKQGGVVVKKYEF